jgi:hypothetical protein
MPRPWINRQKLANKLSRATATVAAGELLAGQVLGIGGALWDVSSPGGDGLSAPQGLASAGSWAGYVYRATLPQDRASAPGTSVVSAEWVAVGETPLTSESEELDAGYVLTSVDDPALSFAIVGPEPVAGFVKYQVRPL